MKKITVLQQWVSNSYGSWKKKKSGKSLVVRKWEGKGPALVLSERMQLAK